MRVRVYPLAWLLLAIPFSSNAQEVGGSDFSLGLAKAPDSKDSNKPATLEFQRNDSGQSDYVTQGAVKADVNLGTNNTSIFSPDVSWNHNTLANTPTDNWNLGANLLHSYVYSERAERLDFDLSTKWQRDLTKSSNSIPVKLDVNWYTKRLESKSWNVLVNFKLRPTISVFWQDVYAAKVDSATGVIPTGILSGEIVVLNFEARMNRWSITASTQDENVAHAVAGQAGGAHCLYSVELNYDFFDQPKTKTQQDAHQWLPGISLMRQVGDDPFNAIARAGFTRLALTLKY